jgi:hypothetical protein
VSSAPVTIPGEPPEGSLHVPALLRETPDEMLYEVVEGRVVGKTRSPVQIGALQSTQMLDGGDLLQSFQAPVSALFEVDSDVASAPNARVTNSSPKRKRVNGSSLPESTRGRVGLVRNPCRRRVQPKRSAL